MADAVYNKLIRCSIYKSSDSQPCHSLKTNAWTCLWVSKPVVEYNVQQVAPLLLDRTLVISFGILNTERWVWSIKHWCSSIYINLNKIKKRFSNKIAVIDFSNHVRNNTFCSCACYCTSSGVQKIIWFIDRHPMNELFFFSHTLVWFMKIANQWGFSFTTLLFDTFHFHLQPARLRILHFFPYPNLHFLDAYIYQFLFFDSY